VDKAVVISNTSPLINLGKIDALNLIPLLFSSEEFDIVVPAEVMAEIKSPLNKQIRYMHEIGQIIISPPFMDSVMDKVRPIAEEIAINARTTTYNPEQHYTEAYVIVKGEIIKSSVGSAFVLMDEKVAKTIAKKKGLRTMTHINIITECVNEGILTRKNGLGMLERLDSKGVKYRQGMLDYYRIIWS
jgi:predicted nucleic acid-binding protein